MRNLTKIEPQFFIDYKNKDKDYKKNPNNYQNCSIKIKQLLREEIIKEQNNQCFYCERKITNNTNKIHIDHIKQRGNFHKLECEYKNMVVSCNGRNNKHCAKYKDNRGIWNDSEFIKLIPKNPKLLEKPSDFFEFVNNGEIKVKENLSKDKKKRGEETIKYLNLNFSKLVEARRVIIGQIENLKKQNFNINDIFSFFNEFETIFKQ